MVVKNIYSLAIAMLWTCSLSVHSYEDDERVVEQQVIAEFTPKLANIMSTLDELSKEDEINSAELLDFVDDKAIKLWSPKNSIRSMLGTERWTSMSEQEQHHMVQAYYDTVRRYLMENLIQFDRHSVEIESLKLNRKRNKGWLTLEIDSPKMAATNVDLKIYKEKGQWTVYDFRFKGVSFISLKKFELGLTFDALGVEGLISKLALKNKTFFQELVKNAN